MQNTTINEQDLVMKMKLQAAKVKSIDSELTMARQELEYTKMQLIELMTSQEKERTATYEGVGFVSLMKPKVRARCLKDNEQELFDYLTSVHREDLVKTTVNANSLSTFVKERLEQGDEIPECISYYLQPDVRLYVK